MSKKSKVKSIEIPSAYQLLTLPDKEGSTHKIIIATDRSIHAFKDPTSPVPADIAIDTEFKCLDDLLSRQEQSILAYHAEYFKCEPPKGQDKTTTAMYLWAYLIKEATPHLPNTKSDGTKERKSTISTRVYTQGSADPSTSPLKTPQASKCLEIFLQSLDPTTKTVTEEHLKAKIYERQVELKTRQDAWRIFQYYRPQLIQAKLLKHD